MDQPWQANMLRNKPFPEYDKSPVGTSYFAYCTINHGYEYDLTIGKIYIITIIERILPMSPLCSFYGDRGGCCASHLYRFNEIIEPI